MGNIKITDENYDNYKEFYKLSKNLRNPMPTKRASQIETIVILVTSFLGLSTMAIKGANILLALLMKQPITSALLVIGAVAVASGTGIFMSAIVGAKYADYTAKKEMKKFQQEHPEMDLNVNIYDLEQELKAHEIQEQISGNLEEAKESHIQTFENDFRKKTTTEKLILLQEEKTFWENARDYENIQEKNKKLEKNRE